ncbi:hypothetical protein CSPX01_02520 [Colletotrichum filicis]|nr:hypothetical protein CSPX01_02520 [Colletotrichum filicis]
MCAGAGAGACVCSCSTLCSVLLLRFLPRCLLRQEEGKVRKVRYEAEVLIKHTGVPALAAAAQRKSQYTHSLHTLYLSLHRPSLPSLPSRVHSLPAPLRSFPRLAFFFFFFPLPSGLLPHSPPFSHCQTSRAGKVLYPFIHLRPETVRNFRADSKVPLSSHWGRGHATHSLFISQSLSHIGTELEVTGEVRSE